MYKQENSKILSLYAVSPVHAGSGSSMGIVDLPIQRERHTNWPHIQSSGVKGAMRHHFEKFKDILETKVEKNQFKNITEKIFGIEKFEDTGTLPGAISVSDAKLLAFPMRSSKSPFVWITSPAVLKRLENDFNIIGKTETITIPPISKNEAIVINGTMSPNEKILLEDYEVTIIEGACDLNYSFNTMLSKADNLILVNDDVYNYGVTHCTEIRTQIKIDPKTGTTQNSSLRYQELLPADSLMYVILFYGDTRNAEHYIPADGLIDYMKNDVIKSHIQIGGDETLGCGLFNIKWVEGGGAK